MRLPVPHVLLAALLLALPEGVSAQAIAGKVGRAGGVDGNPGDGPAEFFDPEHLALDPTGNLYVTDVLNHRVQKLNGAGSFLEAWGAFGAGPGQFNSPRGITVDPVTGDIYVVDSLNDRVQVLDETGTFLRQWGSSGSGAGQLDFPRDVALDGSGNAFVTDMDNHRVQKFTQAGAFVAAWGSFGAQNGQFQFPRGIASDASGDVYVVDSFNHRVQRFTNDGTFVAKVGQLGSGNGQFSTPRDVAVVGSSMWVADTGNDRIQVFSITATSFNYTGQFGTLGLLNGQLDTPRGITSGPGVQWVASSGNHRLDAFGTIAVTKAEEAGAAEPGAALPLVMEVELLPRGRDPRALDAVVRYQLSEPQNVRLIVRDAAGAVLARLDEGTQAAGVHTRTLPAEGWMRVEVETARGTVARTLRLPD